MKVLKLKMHRKYNPHHDSRGRFARGSGAAVDEVKLPAYLPSLKVGDEVLYGYGGNNRVATIKEIKASPNGETYKINLKELNTEKDISVANFGMHYDPRILFKEGEIRETLNRFNKLVKYKVAKDGDSYGLQRLDAEEKPIEGKRLTDIDSIGWNNLNYSGATAATSAKIAKKGWKSLREGDVIVTQYGNTYELRFCLRSDLGLHKDKRHAMFKARNLMGVSGVPLTGLDEMERIELTRKALDLDQHDPVQFASAAKAKVVARLKTALYPTHLRNGEATQREEYAQNLVDGWAGSSTEDSWSRMLQFHANNLFNSKLSQGQLLLYEPSLKVLVDETKEVVGDNYAMDMSDAAKASLAVMYKDTQEALRSAGYKPTDTIKLFRGCNQLGSLEKDKVTFQDNALASWSVLPHVAKMFCGRAGKMIVEAEIPVTQILCTPNTGLGCLAEYEVVVLNQGLTTAQVLFMAAKKTKADAYKDATEGKSVSNKTDDIDVMGSADWIKEVTALRLLSEGAKKFDPNQRRNDAGRWVATAGSSNGIGAAFVGSVSGLKGKKWLADNQERYSTDKEFQKVADAITAFTQGEYQTLRAMATFEATGKWPFNFSDSIFPEWYQKGHKMYWSGEGYFDGQKADKFDVYRSTHSMIDGSRALVNAINSAVPVDQALYRGIGTSITSSRLEEFKNMKVGDVISMPAPTSFTTSEKTAQTIAAGTNAGFSSRRQSRNQITIELESGAKGIHVSALSPWRQQEVLSCGKFEVTEVKVSTSRDNGYMGSRGSTVYLKIKQVAVYAVKPKGKKSVPVIDYDGQDQPDWITSMFDEPWFPSEFPAKEGTKAKHDVSHEARDARGRWSNERSSIEQDTDALKKLGVSEVKLPQDARLRSQVMFALRQIAEEGLVIPWSIDSQPIRKFTGDGIPVASADADGITLWEGEPVLLGQFEEQVTVGFWSQANPILHELGHTNHREEFGPFGTFAYESLLVTPVDKRIAAQVSRYAQVSAAEFVAEVFAGALAGQRYGKKVQELYSTFKGPKLKQLPLTQP